jgi:hypothetical protein
MAALTKRKVHNFTDADKRMMVVMYQYKVRVDEIAAKFQVPEHSIINKFRLV